MATLSGITPNLVVRDLDTSLRFYRDVLGFAVSQTVPPAPPFVFAWLERDGVAVFLNAREGVAEDMPELAARTPGGTVTLFVVVDDVDGLHAELGGQAPIVMALKTQLYGMREFAVTDPDGHVLIFAQRVAEAG